MKFSERFAVHPADFQSYDTEMVREEFLVEEVFLKDEIVLTYSLYDRFIVGGAHPVKKELSLESFDSLKADDFLARREMGIIKKYPNKPVTPEDAEVVELGALESSNARKIYKLLVNSVVETCQLQMGMTELKPGSVWNTMPVHTHNRRMEAYFYFEVPENQAVCHFMGHGG